MALHNLIIMRRYLVEKYRALRTQPTVRRFTGEMIFQHLVVMISFMVLVVTGFALKYPEAWWVKLLHTVGFDEQLRSVIHRIAAVALLAVSVHHVLVLLLTRRGQKELAELMPRKEDVSQAVRNLAFHLGKTEERPRFGRYDYTEKAEYWALVWGTIIMAATGFILWFPATFTSILPPWIVKVAETIHLYEAWLATLAIVVFHFFFVIFHPDRYPMSLSWLTGRMSVEECRHHHPVWYEQLTAGGELTGEGPRMPEPGTVPTDRGGGAS